MNDNQRQAATSPDEPRPAATSSDNEYSLSIEDVAALYEQAGLPRDRRTIQRYCAKGNLVCHRVEIPYGEKFLVTPASVATHIAYIKEVRQAVAGPGSPRLAAADVALKSANAEPGHADTATDDNQRQGATSPDLSQHVAAEAEHVSRPVAADGGMVELLKSENAFLRGQITVKDEQIKDLTERARETNHLIGGLQKMLTPLLGAPDRIRDDARP